MSEAAEAQPKRHSCTLFVLGVLMAGVAVLGIALLLDRMTSGTEGEWQTLPDNSQIRLRAVLGGTDYTFSTKTWRDTLAEQLPYFLGRIVRRKSGYYNEHVYSQGATACAIVERRNVPNSSSNYFRSTFSDASGWNSETNGTFTMYPERSDSPFGVPLQYFKSPASPMQKELTLSLLMDPDRRDTKTKPVEFSFANPLYNPNYKPLQGIRLPTSARDAQLSMSLLRLVTDVDQNWAFRKLGRKASVGDVMAASPTRATGESFTWLAYQVQEGDQITTGYSIESIVATDNAKSGIRNSSSQQDQRRDFAMYQFAPALWSGAGAFRLRFELTRNSNYPADELCTFDAEIPTTATYKYQTRKGSAGLTLVGAAGPGGSTPSGGYRSREMLVQIAVPDHVAPERRLYVVKAVDNLGRRLNSGSRSTERSGISAPTTHIFELQPDREVVDYSKPPEGPFPTSVTLTLAYTPSHFIEFVAEPEAAR